MVCSSGAAVCARAGTANATASAMTRSVRLMVASLSSSERNDVVQDRGLPQQHLADDVRSLDMLGVDRGSAGAAGRQAGGELVVVEPDAHPEGRGLELSEWSSVNMFYTPRRIY